MVFIVAGFVSVVAFVVGFFSTDLAAPVINMVVHLSTEPLSIPIVNQAILWGQLCAFTVVVVIRIVKGIHGGLLGRGTKRADEWGEWLVKTILAVAGVALMPVFCNMVITVGTMMFTDVQNVTQGAQLTVSAMDEDWFDGIASQPLENLGKIFCSAIFLVLVLGACVKTAYDLAKRGIVMLVVSVVAPWVSIKGAMDSADDYLDLLTSLFGLCLTQWVQYIFLFIAVTMFNDYAGNACWVQVDLLTSIPTIILIVAAIGTSIAVPAIIERYSFSIGRGGAGSMIIGMALRGGIRGVGGTISGIARTLHP